MKTTTAFVLCGMAAVMFHASYLATGATIMYEPADTPHGHGSMTKILYAA